MIRNYFRTEDFEKITSYNICNYCEFDPEECNEYKLCCYRELQRKDLIDPHPTKREPLPFFFVIDEEE